MHDRDMLHIEWGSGSAFNHGRIKGDAQYRIERYKTDTGLWFLLDTKKKAYLCCRGPYSSPKERDTAIIQEVNKRNVKGYQK